MDKSFNLKISARSIFFLGLGVVSMWFLFLERAILTPFILAAIFAYVLNPLISFFSEKTRISRAFFIVLFYVLFFGSIGWLGTMFARQFFTEIEDLTGEIQFLLNNADSQIATLPDWIGGAARDSLISLRDAIDIDKISLWPVFSGAASRVFTIITFFFTFFYFLKDGKKLIDRLLLLLQSDHKVEAEILLRKINSVLASYLRAQLLLVFLMGTLGFIIFSLLGVRFALVLGVVIGLAEIIPMIGPIIAGVTVTLVSMFDGASQFGLSPLSDGLIVLAAYVLLNQTENYLIVPQLMGKAVKLHPLLIFFAVLAGGHLFGILGFILAVPIAATLRVMVEFILDKLT